MSEMKTLVINGQTYQVTDSGAVAFNKEQNLNDEQKAQARENIGASSEASVKIENGVLVVEGGGSGGASSGGSTLIVTIDEETGMASHNSTQIYEHVQAGGTAMLDIDENSLLGLSSCAEYQCCFTTYSAEEGLFDEYRILDDSSVEYYRFESLAFSFADNYYIPRPNTAKVGQTIAVETVDEYGRPTQWKAVDFPGGSNFTMVATLDDGSTVTYRVLGEAVTE